jgi:AcrR family transcriptional regulator
MLTSVMARTTPPASERPLRSDAQRNRLRILQGAREVFADRGLDASLDQIAAHAGVGVGTVYRRFPDKDALIDALFEERIGEVAIAGQRALCASDPWDGLVEFLYQTNALLARDRGLKQALLSRGADKTERAREKIVPIATELVARAQQAGSLRADLDPLDLPLIDLMVSAIADMTREVSPELWQRALTIIIDGLATARHAPTPLPGTPLSRDQLTAAATIYKHGHP